MKWYVAVQYTGNEVNGWYITDCFVTRGINVSNVKKRLFESDMRFNYANDLNGSSFSASRYHNVFGDYETKDEAINALKEFSKNNATDFEDGADMRGESDD